MERRALASFLLAVGAVWAGVVGWTFLAMGGAAELSFWYLTRTLLFYGWIFVGPLLLLVGAACSMTKYPRLGAVLLLIGCGILTVWVGYQSASMLRDMRDPLIARPPYWIWVFVIVLTLTSDACAVRIKWGKLAE